ncbi:MAG: hypothetical protein LZF86_140102 [Nitrospira sp.]|nr:MAG: hypothetical protein LZF86_140102 [Nitrospira sp.]
MRPYVHYWIKACNACWRHFNNGSYRYDRKLNQYSVIPNIIYSAATNYISTSISDCPAKLHLCYHSS